MPTEMIVERFDASKLPAVAGINCGDDEFGEIATKWITCVEPDDSALKDMDDLQTEVFLYFRASDNVLLGFGSLGFTKRTIKKVVTTWSIIPHVGLHKDFHGCPQQEPWPERYAAKIMLDLIGRAKLHNTGMLMLKVHVQNVKARRLYDKLQFAPLGQPNERQYQTMVYPL